MKQPKQRHPRNKTLILFLLVLGCAAMLATGTYAAYTSSASVKRVVAARTHEAADQLRFSSNYLTAYDSDYSGEYAIFPISVNSSRNVTIKITVSNYPNNDPTFVNPSQIHYTMTAAPQGLVGCTVAIDEVSGILPSGIKSDNLHTLTVTGTDDTDFSTGYITVVVRPDAASAAAVKNSVLAARLKIVPTAAGASAWKGEIRLNGNYEDNDAINYHIYGTEECEMILEWNTNLIELGDWSKELLGIEAIESSPLRISVGGPDQPTSYLLQFYRKKPADEAPIDQLGIAFRPATSPP